MSSAKLRDSHTPCPRQSPQGSPGRLSISSPVTCRSTVVGGTQMTQHPSANGRFRVQSLPRPRTLVRSAWVPRNASVMAATKPQAEADIPRE